MSSEQPQERPCGKCGKPVMEVNGTLVHVGGGQVEQKCGNCGFVGGQFGKYSACPRCSDATQLRDDHTAS